MLSINRGTAGIVSVGGSLALFVALAFLAGGAGDFFFFFPQYLFSFRYVVKPVAYGFEPLFSPTGATVFGILLWGLVAIGYGLLTRRLRMPVVVLIAPVVVLAVTLIVHLLFAAMGYGLELDGP